VAELARILYCHDDPGRGDVDPRAREIRARGEIIQSPDAGTDYPGASLQPRRRQHCERSRGFRDRSQQAVIVLAASAARGQVDGHPPIPADLVAARDDHVDVHV
jgi:hypothetical protein